MRLPRNARRTALLAFGALLSSVLYAAAFPPLGALPLAWVALVPLLVALARVGPAAGAALGLLFSLASAALLLHWLPEMLARFFDLSPASSLAASAGAIFLCCFPYAAFGATASWCARHRALGPGTVAVAWAACELFRMYGPVPTPWAFLAYSQAPWLSIVQGADLVGVGGVSALLAAVNAVFAGCFLGARRSRYFASGALVTAAVFAVAWLYGGWRLSQDFGVGEPVRVALVQGALPTERRFVPAHRAEHVGRYLELTSTLSTGPSLVLWPELAIEFYPFRDPAQWGRVVRASQAMEAEILLGAPTVAQRHLVREERNSALLLRDGRIVDQHDKVLLMPFSEERPALLPFGLDRYHPGERLRPLDSEVGRLGVLLCSESMYPAHTGRMVEAGAELLANPSNDDWFATEAGAAHQIATLVFRAVENRRAVLRPSTRGRSAVIDAHGRVVAEAAFGESAVIEATLRRSRHRTIHRRLATALPSSGAALALLSPLLVAAGRRHHTRGSP